MTKPRKQRDLPGEYDLHDMPASVFFKGFARKRQYVPPSQNERLARAQREERNRRRKPR